ncbi:uncharacterized protein EV420DRAFT_1652081 [Desarmillaria tabescens]|uniref:Uncharacterized protein n=1 Tax=Armillaria tabescens TaxID=1929756 RepID=A0AA39J7U7_ARMTA|nr:uncharacterized protein EV420DRAFT_1652081 [Desarmillaria tabescens]KAK0437294.1 hypothetical protein EV420DRAFT_1652081 [Desarmillaria tabescens]
MGTKDNRLPSRKLALLGLRYPSIVFAEGSSRPRITSHEAYDAKELSSPDGSRGMVSTTFQRSIPITTPPLHLDIPISTASVTRSHGFEAFYSLPTRYFRRLSCPISIFRHAKQPYHPYRQAIRSLCVVGDSGGFANFETRPALPVLGPCTSHEPIVQIPFSLNTPANILSHLPRTKPRINIEAALSQGVSQINKRYTRGYSGAIRSSWISLPFTRFKQLTVSIFAYTRTSRLKPSTRVLFIVVSAIQAFFEDMYSPLHGSVDNGVPRSTP